MQCIDTNASKKWFIWCNSVKRNEMKREKRNPAWEYVKIGTRWETFSFGQTWHIQKFTSSVKTTHQPSSTATVIATKWPVYGCVLGYSTYGVLFSFFVKYFEQTLQKFEKKSAKEKQTDSFCKLTQFLIKSMLMHLVYTKPMFVSLQRQTQRNENKQPQ